jgi:hypothetical protein
MEISKRQLFLLGVGILHLSAVFTSLLGASSIFSFLNYFTNTGNVAVAVIILMVAYQKMDQKHLIHAVIIGVLINVVYIVLLVDNFDIIGDIFGSEWQWFILHYLTPYILLIDFFVYRSKITYQFNQLKYYLAVPITYLIYALIFGFVTQDYAYFFFDFNELGFFVTVYLIGITLTYLGIGLFLMFLKNMLKR